MESYEALLKIYSIRASSHTQHMSMCDVEELEEKAPTFHHLYVCDDGAQMDMFDTEYVANFKNTTENITPVLHDKKCDGVIFIKGHDDTPHMVFAELKSSPITCQLEKAFKQTIHTFFKYHQLLSMCKNYNITETTLDFVIACHAMEAEKLSEILSDVQNEQMLLEPALPKHFVTHILPKLLRDKKYTFCINEIAGLHNYPFNEVFAAKPITLHLATSNTPTGDNATITFNY